jgi:hypothetical protein
LLAKGDETLVYEREFHQLFPGGGSNFYIGVPLDSIKLEPATYRIRLETLAAIPDLADLPVNFEIGLPGKH